MRHTYFSLDGSYGAADEVRIIDTSRWTGDDWEDIDRASDTDRLDLAIEIAQRYLTYRCGTCDSGEVWQDVAIHLNTGETLSSQNYVCDMCQSKVNHIKVVAP